MTTFATYRSAFFTRAFTAVAILGPILLVIIAGGQPAGMRGELIVTGHILLVAALVTALALRGVYTMGFSHAHELLTSRPASLPFRSAGALIGSADRHVELKRAQASLLS